MQLAAALRPPASAVMQDLRPSQKQHVQTIMQVLSSRFAPQGRQIAYRTDYYNRVQIKGESVDDFGRALKDLHIGGHSPGKVWRCPFTQPNHVQVISDIW